MRASKVIIKNFRGIKKAAEIDLSKHGVFVGDNNVGKSTILEAIDLVLGPERMRKKPVIDEHDFFAGDYLDEKNKPIKITIEVTVVDLNEEQQRHFKDHLQWWDTDQQCFLDSPPPSATDLDNVVPTIQLSFEGGI